MELNKQELLDRVDEISNKFNTLQDYVDAFILEAGELEASDTIKDVITADLNDLRDTLRYFKEDHFGNEIHFLSMDINKLDELEDIDEDELPLL